MRNIKITVSYDGTGYHGFQKQVKDNSIQEEIENALKKLIGQDIKIIPSGRTDTGVHALGQEICFKTDKDISMHSIKRGLNHFLKEDIRVLNAKEMPINFNPRYDAIKKHYRYIISNKEIIYPMDRNYKAHIDYKLDIEKMKQASKYFLGTHDFTSFKGPRTRDTNPVRTIDRIDISKKDDDILIDIEGKSFLRNMIRIMVGTLVDVGASKIEPEDIKYIIDKKDRRFAGKTIEACGLYLVEVFYDI